MYIWLLAAWLPLLFLSPRFALFVGSLCYGAFSLFRLGGQLIGWHLRRKTSARRRTILSKATSEATDEPTDPQESRSDDEGWEKIEYGTRSVSNGGKADSPRETVMGFFHPFSNAGGGGERVLWCAVRANQRYRPHIVNVIYTGDHSETPEEILRKVKVTSLLFVEVETGLMWNIKLQEDFNIHLFPSTVHFIYLSTRRYILSSTYSHFTLLGQSLGSLICAYDAFSMLTPDIFVDTMGYSFTLALAKWLYPKMPTAAYVHYPTISTDMLKSLDAESGHGVNAGTGKGLRGFLKRKYWHLFAWMYGWVGGNIDVVMTNSSWTQAHIRSLWGPHRSKRKEALDIEVVFPPVPVEDLEQAIDINEATEKQRERALIYIAQFRPEKNQSLIIRAFSRLLRSGTEESKSKYKDIKLVLIGSERKSNDDAKRVYELRLLAHELDIKDNVVFELNRPYNEIREWLRRSWVGVNGMWNEHFGITVVEYQAAGLICVVNDSGGPKADIVTERGPQPTGFYASTEAEYAAAFARALSMPPDETISMRRAARSSAQRFTDEKFSQRWDSHMGKLVELLK